MTWAAIAALTIASCGGSRTATDPEPGPTTSGDPSPTLRFGDLPSPCGPGRPRGSPDQGVDDATVTIAYGDDAGYQPTPGLGHEASDAVRALIDWCNEQGGINGREVVGEYHDAKILEVTNVMIEACQEDFMVVGAFWALSDSAEVTRLGCGLPTVLGVVSGNAIANAPLMAAALPAPLDEYDAGPAALLADAFPDAVTRAAGLIADFPTIGGVVQRFQRSATSVGWDWLDCDVRYPITGVTDYRPYVQTLKDCGVEAVYVVDLRQGMINILTAADQLGYHPLWVNSTTVYTLDLVMADLGGIADRLYFGNSFVPLDHTPEGSANAAYVRLVEESGGDIAFVGQASASAFLLWATAAQRCGDDLTRACVVQELADVHDWTAGGLSAPQDPGGNHVDGCTQVMKVEGRSFLQWEPSRPGEFECDPSWAVDVVPLPDAAGVLELGDDRRSHDVLP